jgi:hypothetical protein
MGMGDNQNVHPGDPLMPQVRSQDTSTHIEPTPIGRTPSIHKDRGTFWKLQNGTIPLSHIQEGNPKGSWNDPKDKGIDRKDEQDDSRCKDQLLTGRSFKSL